jgi:hypothetical protein
MHDVLSLGGVYHHEVFEKSARKFCTTPWETIKVSLKNYRVDGKFSKKRDIKEIFL